MEHIDRAYDDIVDRLLGNLTKSISDGNNITECLENMNVKKIGCWTNFIKQHHMNRTVTGFRLINLLNEFNFITIYIMLNVTDEVIDMNHSDSPSPYEDAETRSRRERISQDYLKHMENKNIYLEICTRENCRNRFTLGKIKYGIINIDDAETVGIMYKKKGYDNSKAQLFFHNICPSEILFVKSKYVFYDRENDRKTHIKLYTKNKLEHFVTCSNSHIITVNTDRWMVELLYPVIHFHELTREKYERRTHRFNIRSDPIPVGNCFKPNPVWGDSVKCTASDYPYEAFGEEWREHCDIEKQTVVELFSKEMNDIISYLCDAYNENPHCVIQFALARMFAIYAVNRGYVESELDMSTQAEIDLRLLIMNYSPEKYSLPKYFEGFPVLRISPK